MGVGPVGVDAIPGASVDATIAFDDEQGNLKVLLLVLVVVVAGPNKTPSFNPEEEASTLPTSGGDQRT